MVCSHCNQPGHTYRGCPTITAEEKKEKAKEIKEKKEAVAERRRLREERRRAEQERIQEAQRIAQENSKITYHVANTTNYEIVMYWAHNNDNILRRFTYCDLHSTTTISCIKNKHRIVAFPFLEVCELQSPNARKKITIPESGELPYISVFDMKMLTKSRFGFSPIANLFALNLAAVAIPAILKLFRVDIPTVVFVLPARVPATLPVNEP